MNKFTFITLSGVLSGFAAGLLSALAGYVFSLLVVEHPHQIVPTWMMAMVFGFFLALVLGLVWSIIVVFQKRAFDLQKSVFIASAITFSVVVFLLGFIANR